MDTTRLTQWLSRNREVALDAIRIYLGIGLLLRGVVFAFHPEAFYGFIDTADPAFSAMVLAHYVTVAHLVGGLLLALGLLTRLAAVIQVPVLAGALLFVHLGEPLAVAGQGIEFSALVLVLLLVFTVFGAGRLSIDHVLFVARPLNYGDEQEHRITEQRAAELHAREARTPELMTAPRDSVEENPCIHDRTRGHPRVAVERDFGVGRSLRFVVGTTVMPKRIVFRCADCGGVVEVSTDPDDLLYYRYHEDKAPIAESPTAPPDGAGS